MLSRLRAIDPALAGMTLAAAVLYALVSIVRHETFRSTGYDLALFEQVIGHYSRLETPASAIKGFDSIFADHVSPVLALLAPLYALWPATAALLVAQAALVAAAAIPVFLYARPRVGRGPALALAGAYLLFGGVQEAVWFDFHEVAFAPLLIGVAVVLGDRGRWGWSLAGALALLAVKEDLSFLVVAFGVWYALRGQRRLAVAAVAAGLGWYALVSGVIVDDYGYWSYPAFGPDLVTAWFDDPAKLRTTAYLFGAFLFLTLGSPLAVLTVPLLAERMLSSNEAYWTLEAHYSLTIAPVLALGAADGMRRLRRPRRAAAAIAAIAVVLTPAFPLRELVRPSSYRAAYPAAAAAIARVPAGASVAAGNRLAPHLNRPRLTLLAPGGSDADYVVATIDDPAPNAVFPFADLGALRAAVDAERARRPVVFDQSGVTVLGPSPR